MTRTFDLTGKSSAALTLEGPLRHRGRLRLPVRRGVDRRRRNLDRARRHGRRRAVPGDGSRHARRSTAAPTATGSTSTCRSTPTRARRSQLRFRYRTDGGVSEGGFFGDDDHRHRRRRRRSSPTAPSRRHGWTLDGFTRRRGRARPGRTTTTTSPATGTYVSYDKYLKTGPYYFGYANTPPDWVDHYAYQEGLLISYWDTSLAGQQHHRAPGSGPEPVHRRAPARRSTT